MRYIFALFLDAFFFFTILDGLHTSIIIQTRQLNSSFLPRLLLSTLENSSIVNRLSKRSKDGNLSFYFFFLFALVSFVERGSSIFSPYNLRINWLTMETSGRAFRVWKGKSNFLISMKRKMCRYIFSKCTHKFWASICSVSPRDGN